MTLLLIAVGAAVGAPTRYLLDRAIQTRHDTVFPWGTMLANLSASFILGFLIALPSDQALMAIAGTGFAATLSTYSTFSYETLRLANQGAWLHAALNAGISLIAGLGAAACGITVALAL